MHPNRVLLVNIRIELFFGCRAKKMNPEEAPECLFLAGEVDDTRHPQKHKTAELFAGHCKTAAFNGSNF